MTSSGNTTTGDVALTVDVSRVIGTKTGKRSRRVIWSRVGRQPGSVVLTWDISVARDVGAWAQRGSGLVASLSKDFKRLLGLKER